LLIATDHLIINPLTLLFIEKLKALKKAYFTLMLSAMALLIACNFAKAQSFVYDNNVYVDYIKSVKLSHAGLETSYPLVDLGSRFQGRLVLSFDDLEGGYKRYTYSLYHCDMNWQPSKQLEEIEYLNGFNGMDINDYTYSTNGYSEYTHYRLVLPNEELAWTVSGNYLLVVYDDDLQIPVITRRFMVAENLVNVSYEMIKPRDVLKINTHQELRFTVSYKNFKINQPRFELFATIMQNGNWNTAKIALPGTYERGESLVFDQYNLVSFPALKEFRNFDIRPLSFTTEFVSSIDQNENETTVLLDLSEKRSQRNFIDEIDANGFFVIDNRRFANPEISSEYCRVIFTLQSEREHKRPLYIVGGFCDWQPREEYRLYYDPVHRIYKGEAYFKQGYYDYLFALKNEDGSLDFEATEGSWFETENDYQIIIYYREFGSWYDRIIAVKNFNSNTNN
jgi:hypothetical protein